jgi:hypothetical protein
VTFQVQTPILPKRKKIRKTNPLKRINNILKKNETPRNKPNQGSERSP